MHSHKQPTFEYLEKYIFNHYIASSEFNFKIEISDSPTSCTKSNSLDLSEIWILIQKAIV